MHLFRVAPPNFVVNPCTMTTKAFYCILYAMRREVEPTYESFVYDDG